MRLDIIIELIQQQNSNFPVALPGFSNIVDERKLESTSKNLPAFTEWSAVYKNTIDKNAQTPKYYIFCRTYSEVFDITF